MSQLKPFSILQATHLCQSKQMNKLNIPTFQKLLKRIILLQKQDFRMFQELKQMSQ